VPLTLSELYCSKYHSSLAADKKQLLAPNKIKINEAKLASYEEARTHKHNLINYEKIEVTCLKYKVTMLSNVATQLAIHDKTAKFKLVK